MLPRASESAMYCSRNLPPCVNLCYWYILCVCMLDSTKHPLYFQLRLLGSRLYLGERRSECVYANYSVRDSVNSFLCFLKLLRNSKYSITLNWLINQDFPPMEYKDLLKK